jgi:hypothetical protein
MNLNIMYQQTFYNLFSMNILLRTYIIVSLFFICNCFAQQNPGAKQISMSNSDIALSNDVFALFNNSAGLAQMNWREIGIYYSPAPFGFTELANGYIAYNEPLSFGSVSAGVMTYGFDLYRETKFLAGFSYNYLNKFFAGAALNVHHLSILNYGSDVAYYFNAGGLIYLTEDLRAGFHFSNINRATFGNEDDQIPMILAAGFSYDVLANLSLNTALDKDIRYPVSFLFGIDYNVIEYLSIRSGFSTEPSRYSVGIGINYAMFSLDYALFNHNDLGLTHQAGIIISFGEEKPRAEKIREHLFGK